MDAAWHGNDEPVTALLEAHAAVNTDCDQGPPVAWAVTGDHLSTVKLLIAAGAKLDLPPAARIRRVLGYANDAGNAKKMLHDKWGIENGTTLRQQLNALENLGSHSTYTDKGQGLAAMTDSAFSDTLAQDPRNAFRLTACRDSYRGGGRIAAASSGISAARPCWSTTVTPLTCFRKRRLGTSFSPLPNWSRATLVHGRN
jgi:hypothetical protein